jgi:type II secretory pathway pseudopilin PulG
LIELVFALTMAAVLAASLYMSMQVVFHAKASAEAAVEPARTAETAMEFLRNDLQNALPPTGTLASSFLGTSGSGGPDDVVFFTTADSPEHVSGNGEIKEVELTVATPAAGGAPALIRRVSRNLLAPVRMNPDEEILCRGVTGFHLLYYTGAGWADSWDSTQEQNQIPSAVQVSIELQRPGAQNQPRTLRYVRIFPVSCSTVSPNNPATGMGGLP